MGYISPEDLKKITSGYKGKLNHWLECIKDWIEGQGFIGLRNKYTRLKYNFNDHLVSIEKSIEEMKINIINNDIVGADCNQQDIAIDCFVLSLLIKDRYLNSRDYDENRLSLRKAHNGAKYDKIISNWDD